jgi:hypothetical protein
MRTFNDIIPPSRRSREANAPANNPPPPRAPLNLAAEGRSRFPFVTLIICLLVILVSVGALFYFSKAEVDVTPSSVSAAIQSSFNASESAGGLPFQIITAQKIATQSVQGSGTKTVNTSASGTITIYNTQAKSQTLITNTRFATVSGLVFRIHSAVKIPGGSVANPGSITATVYADQPGSTYNIGATSFTIPGFAGTQLASEVYAQSTDSMTGGASGEVPVVDPTLDSQTRTALQSALAPTLMSSLEAQVPSGYVLIPGASATTYQSLASVPSSVTGQVDINEQGTITAVIFPNAALASAIAASLPSLDYQGEPITLSSESQLLVAMTTMPAAGTNSFSFTIAGTAPLTYSVDSSVVAAAVAGKTRSAAEVALSNYPEIQRAVIILRPFWRQTFPEDPSQITVVSVSPN